MATVSQRFNVDLEFLYGTTEVYPNGTNGLPYPAWTEGRTDWNRRSIVLPSVSKEVENWTGKFTTSEVSFTLADTDGSLAGSLWGGVVSGSVNPLGQKVAVYAKVVENPDYWQPQFIGNIIRTGRKAGLVEITIEDSYRNLLNSFFVPDYDGLATLVNGVLYGTVRDVIGTNLYMDDLTDKRTIHRKKPKENWFGVVFGAAVGIAVGAVTGGLGAAAVGGLSGGLRAIPRDAGKSRSFMKVTDYNIIPDDSVLGGQQLKFYGGSVNGLADGSDGSLFNVPSVRITGGTFLYGGLGTLEVDDLFHSIRPGDYVYAELPLLYYGSPDDIIVNMLTGSNSSVRYSYPEDFSDEWPIVTNPLKSIEAYAYIPTTMLAE